jgi:septal ring-binding cell division protein DamX
MTDVVTPPPATERACPRCGAPLAPDQEWCLSCGADVGARVAPTPRWRLPVALVGALLALLAGALILALVELSGDPQPVAKAPGGEATATATPAGPPADDGGAAAPATAIPEPTVTPQPGASATPQAGVTPQPRSTATPATAGGLATWPTGKSAWTVVIASTRSRADAQRKARAAGGGGGAGVLHSDDYSSLRKGYWVVFAGQYTTRKQAEAAAEGRGQDAYARRVVPR